MKLLKMMITKKLMMKMVRKKKLKRKNQKFYLPLPLRSMKLRDSQLVMTTMQLLSALLLTKPRNNALSSVLSISLSISTMFSLWLWCNSLYFSWSVSKCTLFLLLLAISTSWLQDLCALYCSIWLVSQRLDKLFLCIDTLLTTVSPLMKNKN